MKRLLDDPTPLDTSVRALFKTMAATYDRGHRRSVEVGVSIAEARLLEAFSEFGIEPELQTPFGPYGLDFYFPVGLCVEVDGKQHEERRDKDAQRDRYLRDRGVPTLRIPARDVFSDPNGNARLVAERLQAIERSAEPRRREKAQA